MNKPSELATKANIDRHLSFTVLILMVVLLGITIQVWLAAVWVKDNSRCVPAATK